MKTLAILMSLLLLLCCAACAPTTTDNSGTPQPSGIEYGPADEKTELPIGSSSTLVSGLLTDINLNGKIQSTDEIVPPGTLPDISCIPTADQSRVGETVTINLGSNQPTGSFLFYSDAQSGKERLTVVLRAEQAFYIPLMIILETDIGLDGLCHALSTAEDFSAKIISATNISFEEGMYSICSLVRYIGTLPEAEVISIESPPENTPNNGWYVGNFGNNEYPSLFGGEKGSVSKEIQKEFSVYERIFTRFSIIF